MNAEPTDTDESDDRDDERKIHCVFCGARVLPEDTTVGFAIRGRVGCPECDRFYDLEVAPLSSTEELRERREREREEQER